VELFFANDKGHYLEVEVGPTGTGWSYFTAPIDSVSTREKRSNSK